jgi:hypothetical protein
MIEGYANVLNGIFYELELGDGYTQGMRNAIIVDMVVSSYMLGLDPYDILNELINGVQLIDPEHDDELPTDRVGKVMNYTERFNCDWMIDSNYYDKLGARCADELSKIKVEVA